MTIKVFIRLLGALLVAALATAFTVAFLVDVVTGVTGPWGAWVFLIFFDLFAGALAFSLGYEPLRYVFQAVGDLRRSYSLGAVGSWLVRWRLLRGGRRIWTRKSEEYVSKVPWGGIAGFDHEASFKSITIEGIRPVSLVMSVQKHFVDDLRKVTALCEHSEECEIVLMYLDARSEAIRKSALNTREVDVQYDHGHHEMTSVGAKWEFVYPSISNVVEQILECKRLSKDRNDFVARLRKL